MEMILLCFKWLEKHGQMEKFHTYKRLITKAHSFFCIHLILLTDISYTAFIAIAFFITTPTSVTIHKRIIVFLVCYHLPTDNIHKHILSYLFYLFLLILPLSKQHQNNPSVPLREPLGTHSYSLKVKHSPQ